MNQRIGENIAKLRKINNMSQNDLAKLLNVSNKTISKWECNNSIPDIDILNQIAKIFNISIDELTNMEINLKNNNNKSSKIKDLDDKFNFSRKRVWIPLLSVIVAIIIGVSCFLLFDKQPENYKDPETSYISSSIFNIDKDNKILSMSVSNNTNSISLIDSLTLRENYTWSLYTDLNCKNEIPSKSIELEIGDNVFYIMLKHESDIELYSVNIRRRPLYTVSFESKITDGIQNQTIEEGSCAVIPLNTPTKIGYEFLNWKFDFSQPITNNIKIYGNYNPISYEIFINSKGGVCEIDKSVVKHGESFSLPEPKRDGYLFSGWYYDNNYNSYRINSNTWNYETIEIYASWRALFKTSNGVITGLGDYLSSSITDFVIPEKIDDVTITKIEKNAFENETQIEKITIANTVLDIGESAFYGCSNLKEIILPNNLKTIENRLFSGCSLLNTINLPSALTSIGEFSFYNCAQLVDLSLPNTIISIGRSAFSYCSNLEKIEFPIILETIDNFSFYNCSKLENIIIPRNVTSVGNYAFGQCVNLKDVSLFCSEETTIGENAFKGCVNIQSCHTESIENWLKIKFVANSNPCQISKNLYIKGNPLTEVIVPTGVITINDYAFYGCESVATITIPNSVTRIGQLAFADCSSLTEINFDGDCDSNYWGGDYKNSFKNSGFGGDGITLNIGNNVKRIPARFFGRSENIPNITTINFSENSICTEIEEYAFYNCESLVSINLPNSLNKIGANAFTNTGLVTVFSNNANTHFWVVHIDSITTRNLTNIRDEYLLANLLSKEYSQYDWTSRSYSGD